MIVSNNHSGRIQLKRTFHYFPGMNRRTINGAIEECFESNLAVLVIQEQADKDLLFQTSHGRREVIPHQFWRGKVLLLAQARLREKLRYFNEVISG